MPRDDTRLDVRVDEILHDLWDPIGIKHEPLVRDEYHGYVKGVLALLRRGADQRRVASHLTELERSSMGLDPDARRASIVALALVQARDALD